MLANAAAAGSLAAGSFRFDVATSAGLALASVGNRIVVSQGKATVATLEAPSMLDAKGRSAPVTMSTVASPTGSVLTVTPDAAWLHDPARAFPVRVDPSVSVAQSGLGWVDSFSPNIYEGGGSELLVGDIPQGGGSYGLFPQNGLVDFNLNASLPPDAIVTQAQVNANVAGSYGNAGDGTVKLGGLTERWDPASVTWNQASAGVGWSTPGGTVNTSNPAYQAFGYTSRTLPGTPQLAWYPTQLVQDWLTNPSTNNGMVFSEINPGAGAQQVLDSFTLTVTYANHWGAQSSLRYDTRPIDDRAKLSVQVAGGNALLANNDVSIAGTGLNFDVARSYNSTGLSGGPAWSFSVGPDVNAEAEGDGSVTIHDQTGGRAPYARTPAYQGACTYNNTAYPSFYLSPPGANATLCYVNPGFVLYDHASGSTTSFGSSPNASTYLPYNLNYAYFVSQVIDRNGNTITESYNASNQLSQVTDTQGRTFFVNEDPTTARISQIAGPQGAAGADFRTWNYNWNASSGYLDSYVDPTGAATYYGYDNSGNLGSIYDPIGNSTTLTYGGFGQVASVTTAAYTPSAATTRYAYSYDFAAVFGSTTETDANNNQTTYSYNTADEVTATYDALGHSRSSTYTANADVASVTDAMANVATFSHDPTTNNLTRSQSPTTAGGGAGRATTLGYGDASNAYSPTSGTDTQGNTTTSSYDTHGNQTSSTAQGSAPATKNYQSSSYNCGAPHPGLVCNSTTAGANTTYYGYDGVGNLTAIYPPYPLGATTLSYDANSRVRTVLDGNNNTTTTSYDSNDRVTNVAYGDGRTVGVSFDGDGNVTQRVDGTGTTTYSYDGANRATSKAAGDGTLSVVTYDPVGNTTSYYDGGGTVTYGYDAANQLISLAEPGGTCSGFPTGLCTTFGHDNNGNRTDVSYPSGQHIHLAYDTSGREQSVASTRPNGTSIASRTYTYINPNTNGDSSLRNTITDQTGFASYYAYDRLNRLTAASTSSGYFAYGYDGDGNRTSDAAGAHSYNGADQLSGTSATYDGNGNQTATTQAVPVALGYNAANQTVGATTNAGPTGFVYAGGGQTERTAAGPTIFANGLLGVGTQITYGVPTYFTRDPAGNLISMRSGAQTSYYTLDALGSVLALTDSTGYNDVATYTYDPYGNTTVAGPMGYQNPYRYASGYSDDTTGLIKFGARYYNPQAGQWTQLDPSGQNPGYQYAGDDPVNNIDPSGNVDVTFGLGIYINFSHSDLENIATLAVAGGAAAAAGAACAPGIVTAGICAAIAGVVGYIVADAVFNALVKPDCHLQVHIGVDGKPSLKTFAC